MRKGGEKLRGRSILRARIEGISPLVYCGLLPSLRMLSPLHSQFFLANSCSIRPALKHEQKAASFCMCFWLSILASPNVTGQTFTRKYLWTLPSHSLPKGITFG